MKLHLGCGTDYREGWVNIDIDPEVKSDWCGDATAMPFAEGVFGHIYSHHALEHFDDLLFIVHEMVRVSKDKATWEIVVPYWSWSQNQGNPHHKIYFSEHTFDFFGEKYRRGHREDWTLEVMHIEYGWAEGYDDASGPICMKKYINVVMDITYEIKVHK